MRTLVLLCFLLLPGLAQADEPTITVTVANGTRSFTRGELLVRPDATTIEVVRDVTYRVPMTYRAVPVASLLTGMTLPPDSVIEAVTLDGFIAQFPPDLVLNTDESKAVRLACIRTIPGHQFRKRTRVRGRSTLCGPGPRSVPSAASNGHIRWQSWSASLRPLRAGLRSPSILRCRRQTRSALARLCSSCSASPATS
jgi:hypothetical protein